MKTSTMVDNQRIELKEFPKTRLMHAINGLQEHENAKQYPQAIDKPFQNVRRWLVEMGWCYQYDNGTVGYTSCATK